jgi:hypothetical protein
MTTRKPDHGQTVWIEYPEGRHFEARYDADSDVFVAPGQPPISAKDVANWSCDEHEDTDIADTLNRGEKGHLARD